LEAALCAHGTPTLAMLTARAVSVGPTTQRKLVTGNKQTKHTQTTESH